MDQTEPGYTNILCAIQKCVYNCLTEYDRNVSRSKAEYMLRSLEEQGFTIVRIEDLCRKKTD